MDLINNIIDIVTQRVTSIVKQALAMRLHDIGLGSAPLSDRLRDFDQKQSGASQASAMRRQAVASSSASVSQAKQSHAKAIEDQQNATAAGLPKATKAVETAAANLRQAMEAHEKTLIAQALPTKMGQRLLAAAGDAKRAESAHRSLEDKRKEAEENYLASPAKSTQQQQFLDEMLDYEKQLKAAAKALKKTAAIHDRLSEEADKYVETVGLDQPTRPQRQSSWYEKFLPGPSLENKERLNESFSQHRVVETEHATATQDFKTAQKAYASEVANPTGKNLKQLQATMDAFKKALDDVTVRLHSSAKSHHDLHQEVDRQTKWQKAKDSIWTSPQRQVAKFKQSMRIASKRIQRWRQAATRGKIAQSALGQAKQRLAKLTTSHQTTRNAFRIANSNYRAAKFQGNPTKIATTRTAAQAAAKSMQSSGSQVATAQKGVQAATVTARAAQAGTTAMGMRAIASIGNPIAMAVTAAVVAVASSVMAMNNFVKRQIQASEQLITGQITQHAQYNGRIAGAIALHEIQGWKLGMRTANAVSASAEGVVNSTMDLKETRQPMSEQLERFGNLLQIMANFYAKRAQQGIDTFGFTWALNGMNCIIEQLEGIKNTSDDKAKEDRAKKDQEVLGGSVIEAWRQNKNFTPQKAFKPVPKIK